MTGVDSSSPPPVRVARSAWQWWREIAEHEGRFAATRKFLAALLEFARDSTPERRKRRYGDADYDWEHRVDTTSGSVNWRTRLRGVFHSPYQPTDAELFHEMLADLREQIPSNFSEFTFLDLGSGKGRTLLMASDYPFRRIVGIELLAELHRAALENVKTYRSLSQKCFALEPVCADATEFVFPDEPLVLYLFNPFPKAGLRRAIANLERSLRESPRMVYVLYHSPLLENVLVESSTLKKLLGTHQYAAFTSRGPIQNSD